MKKFIRQLTIFSLIFIMTFSVGFSSQKGINVQAATTQTTATNDGKLRKNGVLFTGISDNKYYKRGVFTKYTGYWLEISPRLQRQQNKIQILF